MTEELKPCPFCGSPAEEGPPWPGHCGCSKSTCAAYHANILIEEWNLRPTPPVDLDALADETAVKVLYATTETWNARDLHNSKALILYALEKATGG